MNRKVQEQLDQFIKNPSYRLFHIDRNCYVVYTGFHLEDERPFIRLGFSPCIDGDLYQQLQYSIINDSYIGNAVEEKALFLTLTSAEKSKDSAKQNKKAMQDFFASNYYIGNFNTLKGLQKFFYPLSVNFLTPHGIRNRSVDLQKKIKKSPKTNTSSEKSSILAYFYDDKNIKISTDKELIFNLQQRKQQDLNHYNEIQLLKNLISTKELPGRKFGVYQKDGNYFVYDNKKYLSICQENCTDLFAPLSLNLFPADLEAIVQNQKEADRLYQNLYQYQSAKSFSIYDARPNSELHEFFAEDKENIVFLKNQTIQFSSRFHLQVDLEEKRVSLSSGGNTKEFEIYAEPDNYSESTRNVILNRSPRQVLRDRQSIFIQGDFTREFVSPYIRNFPDNFRYEFRSVETTTDVEKLKLELNEVFQLYDLKKVQKRTRLSFVEEFVFIIEKLAQSIFQNYEIDLATLGSDWNHFSPKVKNRHPYTNLLQFNRYFLGWQLSGKRNSFDQSAYLKNLISEGYLIYGLQIQFIDNQSVLIFLPEPFPLLYLNGLENPLLWKKRKICQDPALDQFRKKIQNLDLEYFLDLYRKKIPYSPLSLEILSDWEKFYQEWITIYLQTYKLYLQENERLYNWISMLQQKDLEDVEEKEIDAVQSRSMRPYKYVPFLRMAQKDPYGLPMDNLNRNERTKSADIGEDGQNEDSYDSFRDGVDEVFPDAQNARKKAKGSQTSSIGRNTAQIEKGQKDGILSGRLKLSLGVFLLSAIAAVILFWPEFNLFQDANDSSDLDKKESRERQLRQQRDLRKASEVGEKKEINENIEKIDVTPGIDLEKALKDIPHGRTLKTGLYNDFNFDSYIWRYINRLALKNGFHRINANTKNRSNRLKNPHWIYPGNKIILLNGAEWVVKRGESFWIKIDRVLKARMMNFLLLLSETDKMILKIYMELTSITSEQELANLLALDKITGKKIDYVIFFKKIEERKVSSSSQVNTQLNNKVKSIEQKLSELAKYSFSSVQTRLIEHRRLLIARLKNKGKSQ